MPCVVTVQYPQKSKFDLDYYMKTHMPMVQKHWGPLGLKSWSVQKLSVAEGESPYSIQALLYWDSPDAFGAAAQHESAKTVLGDIPNFSNEQPLIMVGDQVGSQ